MQTLNTLSFPLTGAALIEASAGTGKTFTIANIYLRLVLGHECQALSVDKILVVTFTNAATAELKTRVRQRLQQAYLDFYLGHSQDDVTQALIEQSADRHKDCQRLILATKQMDEAAIFTIHGFCQRALLQHAFESGSYYQQQFILDESEYLQLAVEDYWRKQIAPQNKQVLSVLMTLWSEPNALLQDISGLLYRPLHVLGEVDLADCMQAVAEFSAELEQVKAYWLEHQLSQRLVDADFKANSKIAKPKLLQAVDAFCLSTQLIADFDKLGWALFTPEAINKAKKKSSTDLSEFDFEQFQQIAEKQVLLINQSKQAFLFDALTKVRANLASNKQKQNLVSPDDLLLQLANALAEQNANRLVAALQQAYPAVLIDEFQDTDPVQFGIFERLYSSALQQANSQLVWVMIGDPKQAIYAFRGADIFTYIHAKGLLPEQRLFTLTTNWRSQAKLVEAVNQLFLHSANGFLLSDLIQYQSVQAAQKQVSLHVDRTQLAALALHQLPAQDKPITWQAAQLNMATHFATQIVHLLSSAQRTLLADKSVQAKDICVLVRDRQEADLMKQALDRRNVPSVFLVRKSVFATQVALDLYHVLQALVQPQQESYFKAALLTELVGIELSSLDALLKDELRWQQSLDLLQQWHRTWCDNDLMLALQLFLQNFEVTAKLSANFADASRRLTDLRHLIELVQQQSQQMPGQSQLLSWFQQKLFEPEHNSEAQQLRLDTDANLVQIITQHASKGLEFPIVFIPFASRYKTSKQAVFHQQNKLVVDLLNLPDNLKAAEKERLAEDLRLLYVAITRAKFHCALGIWNNAHAQKRNQSEWAATAIGQLLHATDATDQSIAASIRRLSDMADISHQWVDVHATEPELSIAEPQHNKLMPARLKRMIYRPWRLSSYSALSKHQLHPETELPGLDEGRLSAIDVESSSEGEVNPFSFERGAQAGSFLHAVLENIDFQQPTDLVESIKTQSKKYGIDDRYAPMLYDWLADVIKTPWQHNSELSLSALSEYRVEMEFHLPVTKLDAGQFSQLINRYFAQSKRQYSFETLSGMLKGYIDLTFSFQGKFYVADYKSNHVGDTLSDYQADKLALAMLEHDYHLQAILYILALHKWLKTRLPDYAYETHIGGAFYLFLRGIHSAEPANGVYHYLPPQSLIDQLECLFAGRPLPAEQAVQGELF